MLRVLSGLDQVAHLCLPILMRNFQPLLDLQRVSGSAAFGLFLWFLRDLLENVPLLLLADLLENFPDSDHALRSSFVLEAMVPSFYRRKLSRALLVHSLLSVSTNFGVLEQDHGDEIPSYFGHGSSKTMPLPIPVVLL